MNARSITIGGFSLPLANPTSASCVGTGTGARTDNGDPRLDLVGPRGRACGGKTVRGRQRGNQGSGRIEFEPDPEMSFFPTPPDVAEILLDWVVDVWMLPWGDGVRILEPSAGTGHLAAEIRRRLPLAHITCLEPSPVRAQALCAHTVEVPDVHLNSTYAELSHPTRVARPVADVVHQTTLEDYLTWGVLEPFDAVVVNPPYTLPGRPRAWAEQLTAMYEHLDLLAPGGVISAVVPHIVLAGQHKQISAIRGWATTYEMPRGAFSGIAAVSAAGVWAERSAGSTADPAKGGGRG